MSSNVQYHQSLASQAWHAYDREIGVIGWGKWLGARALTCIAWMTGLGTIILGCNEFETWLHNRNVARLNLLFKAPAPDAAPLPPPPKSEEYPDVTIALPPEECPDAVLPAAFRCQQLERQIL